MSSTRTSRRPWSRSTVATQRRPIRVLVIGHGGRPTRPRRGSSRRSPRWCRRVVSDRPAIRLLRPVAYTRCRRPVRTAISARPAPGGPATSATFPASGVSSAMNLLRGVRSRRAVRPGLPRFSRPRINDPPGCTDQARQPPSMGPSRSGPAGPGGCGELTGGGSGGRVTFQVRHVTPADVQQAAHLVVLQVDRQCCELLGSGQRIVQVVVACARPRRAAGATASPRPGLAELTIQRGGPALGKPQEQLFLRTDPLHEGRSGQLADAAALARVKPEGPSSHRSAASSKASSGVPTAAPRPAARYRCQASSLPLP